MILRGRIDLLSNIILVFIVLQASRQSSFDWPYNQRHTQQNSPDSTQGSEQQNPNPNPNPNPNDQDDRDDLVDGIQDVKKEVKRMKRSLDKNVKEMREQGFRSKQEMERMRASIQSERPSARAASPVPLGRNSHDDILDSPEVSSEDDEHHEESKEPAQFSIEAMKQKVGKFWKKHSFLILIGAAVLVLLIIGTAIFFLTNKSSNKKKRETIRGRARNTQTI
ncbi:MAG: hypothetical protein MHMPM18_000008 [Marteilia pararefringens]